MLTNRETYNPEFRLEEAAQRRQNEELGRGKNLDRDLLKELNNLSSTVDRLILDAIYPHRKLPETSSEYAKVFGPLVSLGIVAGPMFRAFVEFMDHRRTLLNPNNYVPRPVTISRYSPSNPSETRMPGSILPFSKEQMKAKIKDAKRLERDFSKALKRVGKHRDELKSIFR